MTLCMSIGRNIGSNEASAFAKRCEHKGFSAMWHRIAHSMRCAGAQDARKSAEKTGWVAAGGGGGKIGGRRKSGVHHARHGQFFVVNIFLFWER
jgi:hypothetical protein